MIIYPNQLCVFLKPFNYYTSCSQTRTGLGTTIPSLIIKLVSYSYLFHIINIIQLPLCIFFCSYSYPCFHVLMGLCLILFQYNPITFMFMAIVLIVLVIKISFVLSLGIWKNRWIPLYLTNLIIGC
jgi:hypothetical protein